MKHFPVSALAFLALAYTGTVLSETRFVAADDSMETRLCISAALDDRRDFSSRVEDANLNIRTVGRHLYCNGQPVAQFAQWANNDAVYKRLRMYSPGFVEIKEVRDVADVQQEKNRVIWVHGKR